MDEGDQSGDLICILKEKNFEMKLSKTTIATLAPGKAQLPAPGCLQLPEKVLQFGTGVLLRGLPDYFIDKANKQGIFNGRIVVVKSTATGGADAFDEQDGLFTLCVRGIENGAEVNEDIVNGSISRVLSAKSDWQQVLECAANPDLQVIISNTTEVGITLQQNDDINADPPQSFPGKLLSFLYHRYKAFNGDKDKGCVIVPTELIPDNGEKLEAIVEELAHLNKLDFQFIDWLENSNHFCSSLVDRIVPGKLPAEKQSQVEQELGYTDDLMIMSEVYRLWAIQSDNARVKNILSFAAADEGVVIADNINKFRELKLRLLNGSHTFSCGLAHLSGFITVKQAMGDGSFDNYIRTLMHQEIAPAITNNEITAEEAREFADKVLDRYRNPHLEHLWLSICVQYASKMQMRNVPVILKYFERFGSVPYLMATGFAAHLLFMKSEKTADGKYVGSVNGKTYPINDDNAEYYYIKWKALDPATLVNHVLGDKDYWGADLIALPGFERAVHSALLELMNNGATSVLANTKKTAYAA